MKILNYNEKVQFANACKKFKIKLFSKIYVNQK